MIRRKKKGFSLLELVAVVTLLGIVAAVVMYRLNSVNQDTAKSNVNKQNVAIIQTAAERYYFDTGSQATSIAQLVTAGYLPTTPTPPGGTGSYSISGGIVSFSAGSGS